MSRSLEDESLETEERAVERYARAFLRGSLFERIRTLRNQSLGGWQVRSVHAIGGEGILFRAEKEGTSGLLKMPHLPYDRPADFGLHEIRTRREELTLEAQRLTEFSSAGILPTRLDLALGSNPLLADRPDAVIRSEVFLVMGFVDGRPIDLETQARLRHPEFGGPAPWLESWVERILRFHMELKSRPPGYYYTDLKPSHVLVPPDGEITLLDAGGIACAGAAQAPRLSPGYGLGRLAPGDTSAPVLESAAIVSLGRTLYASLVNKVLYEGVSLDSSPLEAIAGGAWAEWILEASSGGIESLEEAYARIPGCPGD